MQSIDKAMRVYEAMVDAESTASDRLDSVVAELIACDETGQYLCSGARYLHALNGPKYEKLVNAMVEAAIDRDREHRYLSQLLPSLWGENFMENADQLRLSDNNFRRIFKRRYPDK